MTDYALTRAVSFGEFGGSALSRLIAHWRARRAVRRLRDLDDHLLNDIGVIREEIEWAVGLPLSVNAALALEDQAWKRRRAKWPRR